LRLSRSLVLRFCSDEDLGKAFFVFGDQALQVELVLAHVPVLLPDSVELRFQLLGLQGQGIFFLVQAFTEAAEFIGLVHGIDECQNGGHGLAEMRTGQ